MRAHLSEAVAVCAGSEVVIGKNEPSGPGSGRALGAVRARPQDKIPMLAAAAAMIILTFIAPP